LTLDKLPGDGNQGEKWKMILSTVIGTVATTAAMIAAAAFYFNTRYKALKVELKLSEALRRLPGTPREFKYATIKKATDNFDEARKLGKGGFGAVYRGTLRSGTGTTRSRVDVAVKKFTRDEDRCYDDFLAEVDVINRLRHRNIVPLIGTFLTTSPLLSYLSSC
jgi:interleukin-1 receptor-associated kinase 1